LLELGHSKEKSKSGSRVDLGDLAEDPESEATGSFFDILKGKIPQ
jgi:hypothetical protein